MYEFVDLHRDAYGVEPICRVLAITPSGYCEHKARAADPSRRPARQRRDEQLRGEIRRVWEANRRVYGARKVWRQLRREEVDVARRTVERQMQADSLSGVVRGGRRVCTTRPDAVADRPLDLVKETDDSLIHHSDRGSQYLSMRYTARLGEAGVAPSVGSRGDSYDNALAESVIGLYKAEVIHPGGPWRGFEDVEYAIIEWVAWFNTQRLLEPPEYLPPAEYEAQYHQSQAESTALVALN